jgi:hypothetical protein
MKGKRKNRLITNFILIDPEPKFGEAKAGDIKRRISCTAVIKQSGARVGTVIVPEDAWEKPALFKQSISGIGNLVFLGNGNDLQIIKYRLFLPIE